MTTEERLAGLEHGVADLAHRLIRLESRVCQLMLYLGADPYGKNEPAVVRYRGDPRRLANT